MLVVTDADNTLPDTAWMDIEVLHSDATGCACGEHVLISRRTSGGSHKHYVGGFEVTLEHYADLMAMDEWIFTEHLPLGYRSLSVRDRFPEIFSWLELLDTNVVVVIVLMIIVAIINMASALLIIILERTNMIGVLKALGATDRGIWRIFLIDAAYILGFGVVLGNVLGIGLCLLQARFGLVTLPIESYYVDAVPVRLELIPILALNIGTMVVCVAAMLLPSSLVLHIAPAKAIRFA
jgi:lipoprotein-releasing system permease protein